MTYKPPKGKTPDQVRKLNIVDNGLTDPVRELEGEAPNGMTYEEARDLGYIDTGESKKFKLGVVSVEHTPEEALENSDQEIDDDAPPYYIEAGSKNKRPYLFVYANDDGRLLAELQLSESGASADARDAAYKMADRKLEAEVNEKQKQQHDLDAAA